MLHYISLLGQYNQAKKQQSNAADEERRLIDYIRYDTPLHHPESVKEFVDHFKINSPSDRESLAEALNDLVNREGGVYIVLNYINSIIENDKFKQEDLSDFLALLYPQIIDSVFSLTVNGHNLSKIKVCLNMQQQRIDSLYYNALFHSHNMPATHDIYIKNKNLLSETAQRTGELIVSIINNEFHIEDFDKLDLNKYDAYALLKGLFAIERYDYVEKMLSKPLEKTLKSKACLEGILTSIHRGSDLQGIELIFKQDIELNHPVLLFEDGIPRETTLLLFAFEIGRIDLIERLLKSKKELNINFSNTVKNNSILSLHGYTIYRSTESALSLSLLPPLSGAFSEELLNLGAEVNTPVLKRAIMLPTLDLANKLVSKGARLEDKELKEEFILALQRRNLPLIRMCMRLGAEKFLKDDEFSVALIPSPSGYLCEYFQELYDSSHTAAEEDDFLRLFQAIPENVLKTENFITVLTGLVSSPKMQQNKNLLTKIINHLPLSIVKGICIKLMMTGKLSSELLENTIESKQLRDEIFLTLASIFNPSIGTAIFGEKSLLFSEKAHRTAQSIALLSSGAPDEEHFACLNTDIDVVKYFEAVCANNKTNMIEEIIKRYPELKNNVNAANLAFFGALHRDGDLPSITMLDSHGFSFGQPFKGVLPGPLDNLTPMMIAMQSQARPDLLSALFACQQPLNLDYVAKNTQIHHFDNETVLSYLIKMQRSDQAKRMIEKGANVNLPEGKSLSYALSFNMFDVAELLVSKGAVYPIDHLQDALVSALREHNYRKIKILLTLGGDKYISGPLSPLFDLSMLINLHAILESKEDEAVFIKICETLGKENLHNYHMHFMFHQLIDSLFKSDSKPEMFAQLVKALPMDMITGYFVGKFKQEGTAYCNQFLDKVSPLPSEQIDDLYLECAMLDIKKADEIFITPKQRVSEKASITGQAIDAMKQDRSETELNQYIDKGADIDSLLLFACSDANVKVVSELLKHNISQKVKNDAVSTILRALPVTDGEAMRELLLVFDTNKVPLNTIQKEPVIPGMPDMEVEVTPLIAICINPRFDIAKFLQEVKGDLNVNYVTTLDTPIKVQVSALSILCGKGNVEAAKQLLQKGANVDIPSGAPLKSAIDRRDPAMAELLNQHGARISKDQMLDNLKSAITSRDFALFNTLLQCGGKDYLQDQEIVDYVVRYPQADILNLYLQDKSFLDKYSNRILSNINNLPSQDNAAVIETLFKHGMTLSQEELNVKMMSFLESYPQSATIFIRKGAQLNEEKLREIILKYISKSFINIPSDYISRFEQYLTLWPKKPLNDDAIIKAVLNAGQSTRVTLGSILLQGDTALNQKEKIFEHASCNEGHETVNLCLSKGYITNVECLQRGLLLALVSEKERKGLYYNVGNDKKVSSEILKGGTRLSLTQLRQYLNTIGRFDSLAEALRYGPQTPIDDFSFFLMMIDKFGLDKFDTLLAHGITPEIKEDIFQYAFANNNRSLYTKLLDSGYQPKQNIINKAFLACLKTKDYQTAHRLKEKGATTTYPEVKNILSEWMKIEKLWVSNYQYKLDNNIEGIKLILSALTEKPFSDSSIIETAIKEKNNEALSCFVEFGLTEELQNMVYIYALSSSSKELLSTLFSHGFKLDQSQTLNVFNMSVDRGNYEAAITLLGQGYKASEKQIEMLITKMITLKVDNDQIASLLPFIENEKTKQTFFNICIEDKNLDFAKFLLDNGLAITKNEIKLLLIQAIKDKDDDKIDFLCTIPLPEGSVFDKEVIDLVFANPSRGGLWHAATSPLTPAQVHQAFDFFIRTKDWGVIDEFYKLNLKPSIDNQRLALYTAIKDADKDRVLDLLSKGIDPKTENSKSLALAVRAKPPNLAIVQALLDGGADPRSQGCRLTLVALDNAYDAFDDRSFILNLDIAKNLLMKLNVYNKGVIDGVFASYRNGQMPFPQFRAFVKDAIRSKLNAGQQLGFDLLEVAAAIKKREIEYAGEDSLLLRAREMFEKVVKPTLQEKFNSCPGVTEMEKVAFIERKIKAFILDNIIENTSFETDQTSLQLREFILKHKEDLLAENEQALNTIRSLCTSVTDNAQIAWRAYDPLAPHDPSWENLLTQQLSVKPVHTTAAASEGAMNAKVASEISRTCVAYYFLAIDELNKTNFFQQLADIRRAHDHEFDSPSCFPGTMGRIGRMGEGHPLFQLPPLRKEIIDLQMNAMLLNALKAMLSKLSVEQCELLMYALQQPRPETAEEVVLEKVPYTKEMIELRERFLQELPSRDKIKEKINEAFSINKEPPFKVEDELDLNYHLLDLCAGTRAQDFRQRIDEHKEKMRLEREKDKKSEQQTTISVDVPELSIPNPFSRYIFPFFPSQNIKPDQARLMKKEHFEKLEIRLRQYIEFEVIISGIRKLLPELVLDKQVELTKAILENAIKGKYTLDNLKSACIHTVKEFKLKGTPISDQEQSALEKHIILASVFNGISQTQVDNIISKLKEEILPDDPVEPDELEFTDTMLGLVKNLQDEYGVKSAVKANLAP